MGSFEDFCGSEFWNDDLTWNNASQPDFTPCFQNTVLIWVPCAFLWLLAPIYLYVLITTKSSAIPVNTFNTLRTVVGMFICFTKILDILKAAGDFTNSEPPPLVFIVSPSIQAATFIVATVLVQLERAKGYLTSGVLFLFYFLQVITGIVPFYSKILHAVNEDSIDDLFRFITFYVFYGLLLIQFLLYCFADEPPLDPVHTSEKACPELKSSFLGRLTFWWMNRTIITGFKKPLEEADIFEPNPRDITQNNAPAFNECWEKELNKWKRKRNLQQRQLTRQISTSSRAPLLENGPIEAEVEIKEPKKIKGPSLLKVLAITFGSNFIRAWTCKILYDLLQFVNPMILKLMVAFTEDKMTEVWKGYLYASLFFITTMTQSCFFHQVFHISLSAGTRIKASMIAAIYKKALTMSNDARKDSTVGEIVNLMSVDAQRLQDVSGYLWMVISSPVQISLAVWLLWNELGPSVLAGVGVMVLLIPINGVIAGKSRKLQIAQMKLKDARVKLLNEVLNGIKVLKLYAWEKSFQDKISAIREKELVTLKKYAILSAIGSFFWTCAPFMVTLACFGAFVMSSPDNVLTSSKAFTSLSLFNILRFPMNLLPMMISYIVTASVSLKRIGKFLSHDDLDFDSVEHDENAPYPIYIEDGTFSWEKGQDPVLSDINVEIPDGALVAVVGQVGAGKSSLLSALLGEMVKTSGRVNVRGSVAYVAQQAWIQNATLKDNILFGCAMNPARYQQVIEACALKADLDILPGGDMTEIGEKGINLSGGQKQRVSLARAVYNDADIYYLDDPLSAVDSHVGKHIFDKVVGPEGMLKNKTRILVTHGAHWLPFVDQVIVITDGVISEVGSYDELLNHDGAFAQFLKTYLLNDIDEEDEDEDPEIRDIKERILQRVESVASDTETSDVEGRRRRKSGSSPNLQRQLSRQLSRESLKEKVLEKPQEKEKLIEEEKRETGKVRWTVVLDYLSALRLGLVLPCLLMFLIYQAASVAANFWLSIWTEDPVFSNESIPTNSSQYTSKRDMYLGVYGGLGGAQALFVLLYAIGFAYCTVIASRRMHLNMLANILKCPMSFFDTTPIGRIVNRFSRDIETIDNILPQTFRSYINTLFSVISTIVVISVSTNIFLAVIIPIAILYYLIQRFYIPTSRQLKRIESTTRSPIYVHFSETITGASTIRAFMKQPLFIKTSEEQVDKNLVYYFTANSSNRWLGFRLEFVGSLVVLSAALFAVIGRDAGISGGIVGLSISYALQVTGSLNWMVRMSSDLETNIVSVERVKEYAEIETEAEWYRHDNPPPSDWPQEGQVHFDDFSVRYREGLDLVLRGITFHINGGERVGIVGRTGAGKSSLTVSLFRLIEAAGGKIIIDGCDVSEMGLHQLRSKLTILPQDPVLFSGTLRMNLDPFDEYADAQIWAALDHAHLKKFVNTKPEGLLFECGEGGQNMSVGQRQLVCLARTLLRKTKILILDEATAAVDLETDDLIQRTIQTEFSSCTILTIAHRLNTVMDYDRVMVLDVGKVKEFDTPTNLLSNKKSVFHGMARDAGLV